MNSTYAQKQTTAQKSTASNVSAVNDLRSLSVAQRVVQRAGGVVQRFPADGAFVYYPNISGDNLKDRLPYLPEKICFTPYTGNEVMSADFTGCFMMAFHFVRDKFPEWDDAESYNEAMLSSEMSIFFDAAPLPENLSRSYIAHVATGSSGDAKLALFDAENRGLIEIEAMFKPYRNRNDDGYNANGLIGRTQNVLSDGGARVQAVTGGMCKDDDGNWCANVYSQELVLKDGWKRPFNDLFGDKNPNAKYQELLKENTKIEDVPDEYFDSLLAAELISRKPELGKWKNTERINRRMNAEQLKFETEATKAFFYASLVVGGPNGNEKNEAYKLLKKIYQENPKSLQYALDKLSSNINANNVLYEMLQESPSASKGFS